MHRSRFRELASAIGLVAIVLGAGAFAQQQPQPKPAVVDNVAVDNAVERHVEVVVVQEDGAPSAPKVRRIEKFFNNRVAPPADGYWVGLQLEPAGETLRSQLKLEGEQGLVVTELFPDTPAVTSGFAKHDIVLKVDEQPATDVEGFNKIVQETKGEKELTVTLYRGGAPQTIKVTPAKRPADQVFGLRVAPPLGQEDVLLEWLPKGLDPEHPMRVEFFHPGFVVGGSAGAKVSDLPNNLSVSINKSGAEPAKISVSKGGEKWEVTEKELDKLPPDVRGHVERMLRPGAAGSGPMHVRPHVEYVPRAVITPGAPTPTPTPPLAVAPRLPPRAGGDFDRRFDEVARRLDEIQKALDALVKQRAEEPAAKPQP